MKRQLVIAVLFTWCAAAGQTNIKRTYPFPKDQARVRVTWQKPIENRHEPRLEYIIHVWNFANPGRWSTFGVIEDTSMVFDRQLADSSALFIVCRDSCANAGFPSDTIKVAYRSTAPVQPPAVPDSSNLPFSDAELRSTWGGGPWKYHGAMGWYTRSYDFGTALYFFEQLSPGTDYDCWLSRTLLFPAGKIEVTVFAAGYTDADSVDISIGSLSQRVKVRKGTETRAEFFPSTAVITVPSAGFYSLKIDPRKQIAIASVRAALQGTDVMPPGRVPFVEAVSE